MPGKAMARIPAKAALRNYDFASATQRTLRHDDCGYFNFSLIPRRGHNQGRFDGMPPRAMAAAIGDILFVPPGMTLQGDCAAGLHRTMTCHIDASVFPLDARVLNDHALRRSLDLRSPAIRRGLTRIWKEVTKPNLASPLALDAAATLLAVDVSRLLSESKRSPKRGGLAPRHMRRLEDRIRSEFPTPTVGELAAACEISERHLSRAFLQETGEQLGSYIRAAMLDRAFELLRDEADPVGQIALKLGFASSASFAYAFRQATGHSPTGYRRTSRARA